MSEKYYLGIDGGGTKTEAVLCDEWGRILAHLFCGATNANDIGVSVAIERLSSLIHQAHDLLSGKDSVLYVFGGIAGALNHRETLIPILSDMFPSDKLDVNSDAFNLLSSELYESKGCCLICGTGSVCFVRRGSEIFRIGGWGYLLDQSGSGYAMGRDALEASLRAHDGRGDATMLTGALMEKLGGAPWDKLTEIYEGGKAFIASFAPCVFACAEEGDRIAFEILFRQARYLAEMLEAAYQWRGDWETPLDVVLGGGIFQAKSDLLSLIKQNITDPIHLSVTSVPPVFGAVWEAVRMGSETVTSQQYLSIRNCFMQDYSRQ